MPRTGPDHDQLECDLSQVEPDQDSGGVEERFLIGIYPRRISESTGQRVNESEASEPLRQNRVSVCNAGSNWSLKDRMVDNNTDHCHLARLDNTGAAHRGHVHVTVVFLHFLAFAPDAGARPRNAFGQRRPERSLRSSTMSRISSWSGICVLMDSPVYRCLHRLVAAGPDQTSGGDLIITFVMYRYGGLLWDDLGSAARRSGKRNNTTGGRAAQV
jgi:hypothetical protein